MSWPSRPARQLAGVLLLLQLGLLLACAPYLSDVAPEVTAEPRAWQCPLPPPVPTALVGYAPTVAPSSLPEPIYTTPVPTATPYVRTGSDFYRGQRVRVGPIIFSVVGYEARPAESADRAYHLITIQVEHTEPGPIEIHFEQLSTVRTIRQPDGRVLADTWYPTDGAAQAVALPPARGLWLPGVTTDTIVVPGPAGSVESWGMPFVHSPQLRSGASGDGYVWVRFTADPHCPDLAGGPPADALPLPVAVATPAPGRGGWPVPVGTHVSRGYGCHPFYTGVLGNCPRGLWWHDGIDFAATAGTPVYAVRDLQIEHAGADTSRLDCSWIAGSQPPHQGFGLYVRARDRQGYTYWYGHLSGFTTAAGAQVANGHSVGRMGSTGCSTGSHLHFRVRRNGLDRNPLDVIQER